MVKKFYSTGVSEETKELIQLGKDELVKVNPTLADMKISDDKIISHALKFFLKA